VIIPLLIFKGAATLFSTVAALVFISTNSAQVCQFFCSLANTCSFWGFFFLSFFFW
jgi:hypothetical protein